jgi:ComF family protein
MAVLQQVVQRALALVLPARCVGCGKARTYLCDACVESMDEPNPRTIVADAYAFDGATAAVVYDGVARDAVHRFKFKNLRALAPYLAAPVARVIPAKPFLDAVVAVPMHPSRLRERGYNQAALLGKGIADLIDVPFEQTWLTRSGLSGRQVEAKDVAERQANVRSAFEAATAVAGLRVALIDDVMTTGSTLDAAAAALKAAGAFEVHCYTFARDV